MNHVLDGDAHWRHLANITESSVSGGDAAPCQITSTTCLNGINLKPRLHDTTCCQTGCQTDCQIGLTTGCIVYTNIQLVVIVKPI